MEHVTRYVRPAPIFTEREADELLQFVEMHVLRVRANEEPLKTWQRRQLTYLVKLRTALELQNCIGRLAVSTVTYEADGNRGYLAVCNLHLEPVPCAYCTDTPEG
jgi:hypothetical protein